MTFLAVQITANPQLSHRLRRYLTHLGDGLLVGDLNTRNREEIIRHIHAHCPPGRYHIAWPDPTTPQGWTTQCSTQPHAIDGLILAITNR